MIVYFDTSALLPLVVHDPSSRLCRRLWNEADHRVTCDGAYVELAGILALGEEGGQLTAEGHEQAWMNVTRMWPTLDVVHMVPDLVVAAARYARPRHLTGAAAVHYAAVAQLCAPELIAASCDGRLLDAWRDLGVATVHTGPAEPKDGIGSAS